MDITIIIVNYNTADDIKNCIESALLQKNIQFEIIVVDNASQDRSLEVLAQFGDKIRLIKSDRNLGFGKANNLAATYAEGRYLLLFNPDALFQTEDDLQHIFSFMRQNKQYGLVGARIVKKNGVDESKPNDCYPGEKSIGFPYKDLPGKIAWVLGACMVIRRKVYEKTGGFDEDFFLYGEDLDLCLRIRKLGYEIGYLSTVTITHIGGASERETNWYELTMKKQKALHLFYQKHYSESAVKFLIKRDRRQARTQLLLGGLLRFLTLGFLRRAKEEKYRAIYNSCKEIFIG